jgi:hypothetical protein
MYQKKFRKVAPKPTPKQPDVDPKEFALLYKEFTRRYHNTSEGPIKEELGKLLEQFKLYADSECFKAS